MISIIIPTKNGAPFIEKALRSIKSQTEQSFEIIIINDASTDNTSILLAELQKEDIRIRIITNTESIGPGLSRHKGIAEAQGDFIAFIDDDDQWLSKEKLAVQKRYLEENLSAVVVGSSKNNFIKEDGSPYPVRRDTQPKTDEEIRKEMLWRNPFITSSVMFKKSAYIQAGGFANMFLAEDYDLWMRMGKIGIMENLSKCEIAYTVRKKNASNLRQQEMNRVVLDLVKKYGKDYPHFYYINLLKAYMRIWLFNIKHLF